MSSKLWEYFLHDDVESFQQLLASASYASGGQRAQGTSTGAGGSGGTITKLGSPSTRLGSSPTLSPLKPKKPIPSTTSFGPSAPGRSGVTRTSVPLQLSRAELNVRDEHGRTLLHHVASSQNPSAVDFALALLEVPLVDIYAQDWESGWTALHRALYAGNATIAQALMARDMLVATDFSKAGMFNQSIGGLIKIKDRDGYSPFDVYGSTIASRDITQGMALRTGPSFYSVDNADSEIASLALGYGDNEAEMDARALLKPRTNLQGDEVFTFGSNKNMSLGLGDQDDRQFPERVSLKRPEHLLRRFDSEFREGKANSEGLETRPEFDPSADLPTIVRHKPITFQNIVMSKLHTAILTSDPESNLYMSGFGPGGRLGTGDEATRFGFVCIETGGLAKKRVVSVALGQDHTLAITDRGEVFSWGSNRFGQLGYSLPRTNNKNDIPIQLVPRQIFNPFKKETILGVAASATHSVVFSSAGLYTFGKNDGQLGLVDSDARSLEMQTTPRRVGASLLNSGIQMVSAIDRATAVLLQHHEVWVFSQYGYSKLSFPLDSRPAFVRDSFMWTRYDSSVNRIVKITSGGNTICALSRTGEVYTVEVNKPENMSTATSTTNPSKIRNSLSPPIRAWSVKKSHMAARDVDVGQDGSIILCTTSGSAWRKEKRTKIKDGVSKDYKFSRIPGLSRVVGVRSNAFGAYAVAQRECTVTKEQIVVGPSTLWSDFMQLAPFKAAMTTPQPAPDGGLDQEVDAGPLIAIEGTQIPAADVESRFLPGHGPTQDETGSGIVWIKSTVCDARIPVHEFLLSGRSQVLREALHTFRESYYFALPDILAIEYDRDGKCSIIFQGVDFLAILNFALFLYTDSLLDVWFQPQFSSQNSFRYRQVRIEVMRIATHLGLSSLERAVRLMIEPKKTLQLDLARAINEPSFFDSSDVTVQLAGESIKLHSQVLRQRSPFFDAIFYGRSGGRWLAMRQANAGEDVVVDLKHIDPEVFKFVLQYIYADTDEELFDDVRTKDLDEFIDLVLDVMFVADELMIDRLAQICQKVLGRFVSTRNLCQLLNSVAPCATADFKHAALEFICLNLEDMLANRLLDGLAGDLLRELDSVCQDNQLACYPVSRGRNSNEYVFEKYPELAELVERNLQRRIDSMRLRSRLNKVESDDDKLRPTSSEKAASGPTPRKGKAAVAMRDSLTAANSPILKARQSTGDLMFQMDDEVTLSFAASQKGKAAIRGSKLEDPNEGRLSPNFRSPALGSSLVENESYGDRGFLVSRVGSGPDTTMPESPLAVPSTAVVDGPIPPASLDGLPNVPWASPSISSAKRDLKDIMAETSQSRLSNLTLSMSGRRDGSGGIPPKLSQKERKKLQQQQLQERTAAEEKARDVPQNPWQTVTPTKRERGLDESSSDPAGGIGQASQSSRSAQKPAMTLRQTVAGTPPPLAPVAPGSPSMRSRDATSGAANLPSSRQPSKSGPSTSAPSSSKSTPVSPQPAIQSIRHIPRPEPYRTGMQSPSSGSLSLATILMQQQTEKDEIREAATAKHNLQDIQLEQEFQEWWDKESRRVMGLAETEVDAQDSISAAASSSTSRGREGKGSTRGGGGRGNGSGQQRRRRGPGTSGRGSDPANAGADADDSGILKMTPTQPSTASQAVDIPDNGQQIRRDRTQRSSSGHHHHHRGARGGSRGRGRERSHNP